MNTLLRRKLREQPKRFGAARVHWSKGVTVLKISLCLLAGARSFMSGPTKTDSPSAVKQDDPRDRDRVHHNDVNRDFRRVRLARLAVVRRSARATLDVAEDPRAKRSAPPGERDGRRRLRLALVAGGMRAGGLSGAARRAQAVAAGSADEAAAPRTCRDGVRHGVGGAHRSIGGREHGPDSGPAARARLEIALRLRSIVRDGSELPAHPNVTPQVRPHLCHRLTSPESASPLLVLDTPARLPRPPHVANGPPRGAGALSAGRARRRPRAWRDGEADHQRRTRRTPCVRTSRGSLPMKGFASS